jgi:hypothetical protein
MSSRPDVLLQAVTMLSLTATHTFCLHEHKFLSRSPITIHRISRLVFRSTNYYAYLKQTENFGIIQTVTNFHKPKNVDIFKKLNIHHFHLCRFKCCIIQYNIFLIFGVISCWSASVTDGWAVITKLVVAFLNFEETPEIIREL